MKYDTFLHKNPKKKLLARNICTEGTHGVKTLPAGRVVLDNIVNKTIYDTNAVPFRPLRISRSWTFFPNQNHFQQTTLHKVETQLPTHVDNVNLNAFDIVAAMRSTSSSQKTFLVESVSRILLGKSLKNVQMQLLSQIVVKIARDTQCRTGLHTTWKTRLPEILFIKNSHLRKKKSGKATEQVHRKPSSSPNFQGAGYARWTSVG